MSLSSDVSRPKTIRPRAHIDSVVRLVDRNQPAGELVRLDKNERVSPFSDVDLQAMRECLTTQALSGYPDFDLFYDELAEWAGVAREMLLLTGGSDQAIKSVFETYVDPGDVVLLPRPTFAMYGVYCGLFQAHRRELHFTRDLELSADSVCEALRPGVRLLALPNPNAPAGTIFGTGALARILERAESSGTLVLADEAYFGFSEVTSIPLVARFGNLVVTRTFSKAFGLAGVRLGFIVSSAPNIDRLRRVKPMYEASGVALALGQYMIRNDTVVSDYTRAANEGKCYLKERFRTVGRPFDSEGNFLVVRMPPGVDIERLVAEIRQRGFLIKGPFSDAPMTDCIRITTGPVDLMAQFWTVFEQAMATVKASAPAGEGM
jgi:histidinol-phosphate aminotransferase